MNIDDGTGTDASFNRPTGLTSDGTNLYVLSKDNNKIRKVVISTGVVTSIACSSGCQTTINDPSGITTDGTNLYLSSQQDRKIIKIE